jgi:hypothetical protein
MNQEINKTIFKAIWEEIEWIKDKSGTFVATFLTKESEQMCKSMWRN